MSGELAVLVAPWSPQATPVHLGAARKIELVARTLLQLGYALHVVDSSHAQSAWAPAAWAEPGTVGGIPVAVSRPARLPYRPLGKLLNALAPGALLDRLAALRPALVWIYNPYAFEARIALALRARTGARLVLELEDLPRARRRGFNPKPLIDERCFARLLRVADLVTYVNAELLRRHPPAVGARLLLPSLLDERLVAAPARERCAMRPLRLGYFGGLEPDKGAAVLLELLERLPQLRDDWRLLVTGSGALEPAFRAAAHRHPRRLEFLGRVAPAALVEAQLACDAIVNPHAPIAAMRDGVFPFKVCEALATGAVLISTALPSIDVPLAPAVLFCAGEASAFAEALDRVPQHYRTQRAAIDALAGSIRQRHGTAAFADALRPLLAAPALSAAGSRSAVPTAG